MHSSVSTIRLQPLTLSQDFSHPLLDCQEANGYVETAMPLNSPYHAKRGLFPRRSCLDQASAPTIVSYREGGQARNTNFDSKIVSTS